MKAKTIAVALAAVAILSLAACNRNSNANQSPATDRNGTSLPGGTPGTAGAPGAEQSPVVIDETSPGETSAPGFGTAARQSEFSDENVSIDLSLDRESYTVNELIGLSVTITNNAQTPILFERGSGSNRVPDALRVNFGKFATTFIPPMMTMDYQLEELQPGESVTYDLPYAPYASALEDTMPGAGFEQTIDFFQTDEYTPVQAGEVAGDFTFTYLLADTDTPEAPFDFTGENARTITGSFTTNIVD